MDGSREGSDEGLWQRVLSGDGEAFGAVFDRHRDRIFRHCVKLVGSADGAEDITAMVFYEAWRRREYVRVVNDSIVAWLLVTANYTVKNDLRQRRRYRNFLNRLPQPANCPDVADAFIDEAEQENEAAALQVAFARLRTADRDVLTLCVVEDMSIKDAAIALGIVEGTVKSRLNRAKTRLGHLYNEISRDQAIDPQAAHERRTV